MVKAVRCLSIVFDGQDGALGLHLNTEMKLNWNPMTTISIVDTTIVDSQIVPILWP